MGRGCSTLREDEQHPKSGSFGALVSGGFGAFKPVLLGHSIANPYVFIARKAAAFTPPRAGAFGTFKGGTLLGSRGRYFVGQLKTSAFGALKAGTCTYKKEQRDTPAAPKARV